MSRFVFILVVLSFLLSSSLLAAQVVPVSPADFQPGATIEGFEDMYQTGAFFDLTPGTTLASGIVYSGPMNAMVVDFDICTICGVTLPGGDVVDGTTQLPSGTALLSLCGRPSMTFELPHLVEAVGFFFEDGMVELTAHDTQGGVLGTVSAAGNGVALDGSVNGWVGLAAAGGLPAIARVEISGYCFVLDDLTVGSVSPAPPPRFRRGDCNADGNRNLADTVFLLELLFPTGIPGPILCEDACDVNDDGTRNLADAITLLNALFGVPPGPLPPPDLCDVDPTASDSYRCDSFAGCP